MDKDGRMVEIWPPKRRRVGPGSKGRHQRRHHQDCPSNDTRLDHVSTHGDPFHIYPPASSSMYVAFRGSYEDPLLDTSCQHPCVQPPDVRYVPECVIPLTSMPVLRHGQDPPFLHKEDIGAHPTQVHTPDNAMERRGAISHPTRRSLFSDQPHESSQAREKSSQLTSRKKTQTNNTSRRGRSMRDAITETEPKEIKLSRLQKWYSKSSPDSGELSSSHSYTSWHKRLRRMVSTKSNDTQTSNTGTSQDSFEVKDKAKKVNKGKNLKHQKSDEAQTASRSTDSSESKETFCTTDNRHYEVDTSAKHSTSKDVPNASKYVLKQETKKTVTFASSEKSVPDKCCEVNTDTTTINAGKCVAPEECEGNGGSGLLEKNSRINHQKTTLRNAKAENSDEIRSENVPTGKFQTEQEDQSPNTFKGTGRDNNVPVRGLQGLGVTGTSSDTNDRKKISQKRVEDSEDSDKNSEEQKKSGNTSTQTKSMAYIVSSQPELIPGFKLPFDLSTGGFQQNLFMICPQDLSPLNHRTTTEIKQEVDDKYQSTRNPVTEPAKASELKQNGTTCITSQRYNISSSHVPEVGNPSLQIVETNQQNLLLAHTDTPYKFTPGTEAQNVKLKQDSPLKKLLTEGSAKESSETLLKPTKELGRPGLSSNVKQKVQTERGRRKETLRTRGKIIPTSHGGKHGTVRWRPSSAAAQEQHLIQKNPYLADKKVDTDTQSPTFHIESPRFNSLYEKCQEELKRWNASLAEDVPFSDIRMVKDFQTRSSQKDISHASPVFAECETAIVSETVSQELSDFLKQELTATPQDAFNALAESNALTQGVRKAPNVLQQQGYLRSEAELTMPTNVQDIPNAKPQIVPNANLQISFGGLTQDIPDNPSQAEPNIPPARVSDSDEDTFTEPNSHSESRKTLEKSIRIQPPLPVFHSLKKHLPGAYWTPIHIESRMPLCFFKGKSHRSSQSKTNGMKDSQDGSATPLRKASKRSSVGKKPYISCFASKSTFQTNIPQGSKTSSPDSENSSSLHYSSSSSASRTLRNKFRRNEKRLEKMQKLPRSTCGFPAKNSSSSILCPNYSEHSNVLRNMSLSGWFGSISTEENRTLPSPATAVSENTHFNVPNAILPVTANHCFLKTRSYDTSTGEVAREQLGCTSELSDTCLLPKRSRSPGDEYRSKQQHHRTAKSFASIESFQSVGLSRKSSHTVSTSAEDMSPLKRRGCFEEDMDTLRHRWSHRNYTACSYEPWVPSRKSSQYDSSLSYSSALPIQTKMLQAPSNLHVTPPSYIPASEGPPTLMKISDPDTTILTRPKSYPSDSLFETCPTVQSSPVEVASNPSLHQVPLPAHVAFGTSQPPLPVTSIPRENLQRADSNQSSKRQTVDSLTNPISPPVSESPNGGNLPVLSESVMVEPADPFEHPLPSEPSLQPTVSFSISTEDIPPSFPKPRGMQPVSLVFIPVPTVYTPSTFGSYQSYPVSALQNMQVEEDEVVEDERPDTTDWIVEQPQKTASQEVYEENIPEDILEEPDYTTPIEEYRPIKQEADQPPPKPYQPEHRELARRQAGMSAQTGSLRFLQLLAIAMALAVAMEVSKDFHEVAQRSSDCKSDTKRTDPTPDPFVVSLSPQNNSTSPYQTEANQSGKATEPMNFTDFTTSTPDNSGIDETHGNKTSGGFLPQLPNSITSTVPSTNFSELQANYKDKKIKKNETDTINQEQLDLTSEGSQKGFLHSPPTPSKTAEATTQDMKDSVEENAEITKTPYEENSTALSAQIVTEKLLRKITAPKENGNATGRPVQRVTEFPTTYITGSVTRDAVKSLIPTESITESFGSDLTKHGNGSEDYPHVTLAQTSVAQTSVTQTNSPRFIETAPQIISPPPKEIFRTTASEGTSTSTSEPNLFKKFEETFSTPSTSSKSGIEVTTQENVLNLQSDSSDVPGTILKNSTSYKASESTFTDTLEHLDHGSSEKNVHTDSLSLDKIKLKKKSRFYIAKTGDINKHFDKKIKDSLPHEIRANLSEEYVKSDTPQKRQINLDFVLVAFYDNFYNETLYIPYQRLLTDSSLFIIILHLTIFMLAGYAALLMVQIFIAFNGGRNACECPFVVFGLVWFTASGAYFIIKGHLILGVALIFAAFLFFIEAFYFIFLCASKRRVQNSEPVLSITTGGGAIFIEIVSNTLGSLSCFAIVGTSGMVCFLSLAFICTYCQREAFSRPALLLAASVGAFLFFALALHSGIKQFTANKTTLLSFAVFALCLVTAVVLYIDALITYCGGPYEKVRLKRRDPKEKTKTQNPTERPRSPKQERP